MILFYFVIGFFETVIKLAKFYEEKGEPEFTVKRNY